MGLLGAGIQHSKTSDGYQLVAARLFIGHRHPSCSWTRYPVCWTPDQLVVIRSSSPPDLRVSPIPPTTGSRPDLHRGCDGAISDSHILLRRGNGVSVLAYVTLSLFYTIRALQAQTTREGTYSWLTASTAAAAAFLLRYVGVACVAGVVITALLPGVQRDRRTRALRLALAASPAALVVGAVFLRNWVVSGALVHALPGSDRFWSTLGPSIRGTMGSIVGSKELLGPHLSFLRPLELSLLAGLTGLALVSFWKARAASRQHRLPLPGTLPSGVIGLFIILGLAVAVRGVAAVGVSLESRYVTIYLPWYFVLLLGWALRGGSWRTGAMQAGIAKHWVHLACLVWLLSQAAVTARYFRSQEEDFIVGGSRSPIIAWVQVHVPPNETILTDRGPDLAYWCPNPLLRLPRRPFSARGVTTWETIDRLASKAHARYLVHTLGFPDAPKSETTEEFRFLRSLDTPENFPERNPISLADGVVYQVGVSVLLPQSATASDRHTVPPTELQRSGPSAGPITLLQGRRLQWLVHVPATTRPGVGRRHPLRPSL